MTKGNKKGGNPNPKSCCSDAKKGCCSPKIKEKTNENPETITVETLGAKKSVSFESGNLQDTGAPEASFLDSLSPAVQSRVKALQQLQNIHSDLEKDFVKELRLLEQKYEGLYAPLYEKRSKIVKGEYEPVKEDLRSEDQDSFVPPTEDGEKGIPEFWLTVFQKHDAIAQMITDRDVDALKHLVDLKYMTSELKLRFEFTFSENPYFTDSVLVKTFYFEADPETGEESGSKTEGSTINWKPGQNLTEQLVKKKIKQRGGKAKVVNKKEPCDSFFNFFSSKSIPEGWEEADEITSEHGEMLDLIEEDFEIGNLLKETLIPHAVKWFTGELTMEDEDEEDLEEDEEDEELDEDDEDDDDALPPPSTDVPTKLEQPPECKQQ